MVSGFAFASDVLASVRELLLSYDCDAPCLHFQVPFARKKQLQMIRRKRETTQEDDEFQNRGYVPILFLILLLPTTRHFGLFSNQDNVLTLFCKLVFPYNFQAIYHTSHLSIWWTVAWVKMSVNLTSQHQYRCARSLLFIVFSENEIDSMKYSLGL